MLLKGWWSVLLAAWVTFTTPSGVKVLMWKCIRVDAAQRIDEIGRRREMAGFGDFYRQVLREDGDYWTFSVKDSGLVIFWGSDVKVVVERKDGKVFESDACFFVRQALGSQVMDCRSRGVVLGPDLERTTEGKGAVMLVKFPSGSVGDLRQVKSLVVKNLDKGVRQK